MFCFRDLAEAGIVQNHQEAEADQTSFHGRFRSTAIAGNPESSFARSLESQCPGSTSPDSAAGSCLNACIVTLTKKLAMLSF